MAYHVLRPTIIQSSITSCLHRMAVRSAEGLLCPVSSNVMRHIICALHPVACCDALFCCRFAVIGSTGQHYTVELANEKHTCQCMDFRSRRRACKHIKLVLQQVGIPADSKDWHQVCIPSCEGTNMYTTCMYQLLEICTMMAYIASAECMRMVRLGWAFAKHLSNPSIPEHQALVSTLCYLRQYQQSWTV